MFGPLGVESGVTVLVSDAIPVVAGLSEDGACTLNWDGDAELD